MTLRTWFLIIELISAREAFEYEQNSANLRNACVVTIGVEDRKQGQAPGVFQSFAKDYWHSEFKIHKED